MRNLIRACRVHALVAACSMFVVGCSCTSQFWSRMRGNNNDCEVIEYDMGCLEGPMLSDMPGGMASQPMMLQPPPAPPSSSQQGPPPRLVPQPQARTVPYEPK